MIAKEGLGQEGTHCDSHFLPTLETKKLIEIIWPPVGFSSLFIQSFVICVKALGLNDLLKPFY